VLEPLVLSVPAAQALVQRCQSTFFSRFSFPIAILSLSWQIERVHQFESDVKKCDACVCMLAVDPPPAAPAHDETTRVTLCFPSYVLP
jgi:hypothetical protein